MGITGIEEVEAGMMAEVDVISGATTIGVPGVVGVMVLTTIVRPVAVTGGTTGTIGAGTIPGVQAAVEEGVDMVPVVPEIRDGDNGGRRFLQFYSPI